MLHYFLVQFISYHILIRSSFEMELKKKVKNSFFQFLGKQKTFVSYNFTDNFVLKIL